MNVKGYISLLITTCFPACTLLATEGLMPWEKECPENYEDLLGIEVQIQKHLSKTKSAVVSLETEDGAGSGVIVSAEGLVLTAAHVIGERGKKITAILSNGKRVSAVSLGGSVFSDAGMLKIESKTVLPFVDLAKVKDSSLGNWCYALGHPSGFDSTRGQVLRLGRIIGKQDETMQTDCRLLGGDSGGPLFNLNGEVIAIHSRISQLAEENFHIPIETFVSNWDFFMSDEFYNAQKLQEGGFLGVASSLTTEGLTVLGIVEGSAAEKFGLLEGDILKSLDGELLDSREKLAILVSNKSPKDPVILELSRSGRLLTFRVPLGSRMNQE